MYTSAETARDPNNLSIPKDELEEALSALSLEDLQSVLPKLDPNDPSRIRHEMGVVVYGPAWDEKAYGMLYHALSISNIQVNNSYH